MPGATGGACDCARMQEIDAREKCLGQVLMSFDDDFEDDRESDKEKDRKRGRGRASQEPDFGEPTPPTSLASKRRKLS